MLKRGELSGDHKQAIKIGLVTGNIHKVEEINELAKHSRVRFYKLNIRKIEIQAEKLETIALHAARHAFEITKTPLVVDDSGLFIEALNGFPGPYSSYVFETIGYEGILRLMKNIENRRACFKTAAALILPPVEMVFTGVTCGRITYEPRGSGGFGFDPIFIPENSSETYAEMSLEEKNRVSHRSKAFRSLIKYLEELKRA
jgi:XTP/dITP diphosphohydrolase